VPIHRGHFATAVAHATGHRLHGGLAAPLTGPASTAVWPRLDVAAPPRGRDPPWFATLRGALAAMGGAALLSLTTSLWWLLWSAHAAFAAVAEEGALTLELALLFGSLVNLVAVVSGCWSAVLARRA